MKKHKELYGKCIRTATTNLFLNYLANPSTAPYDSLPVPTLYTLVSN